MKLSNINRAVLFSIIGLSLISIVYRLVPRGISPQKTTLYLDLWYDDYSALETAIAAFEEQNPDIVVIPVVHSYHNLAKKLFEEPANDNGQAFNDKKADLVLFDMDWLPNFPRQTVLEPLTAFPKDNPDINMLYEISKKDGNPYAIPLFSHFYAFFYNIDILKDAGFDRPPKDRDEFLRYCRVLKEKQIAGIGFSLSPGNYLGMQSDIYSWFWNSNIFFMQDDEPQFSTLPVRETLSFLDALSKEHLLSPESFTKTESEKIDEFCGGKTAMMTASLSAVSEIEKKAHFSWGISSVPAAASYIGNPLFVTETSGIGIYAGSGHKDEAWKFITFLSGAEQNAALASSYYCFPENPNASILFGQESPQLEKALELFHIGKAVNEFDLQPGLFTAEKVIRNGLQDMMSGAVSPESAAETMQETWEEEL